MGQLTSKNGPSREDVTYLLRNTNYSKEAIVGWHKVFRRNNKSGSLSQAQFLDLYTKFFPSGEASDYIGHVFRTYGKSRNGGKNWQLGFRDYLLAVHETQCGSEEARLRRAFKMFDMCKWRRRTWWACTSPQGGCSPKGPSMRRRKPGRFSSDLTYSGNLGVG